MTASEHDLQAMTPPESGLDLEFVPQSVGRARRWITDRLSGCSGDLVANAQLLVSELVTNALLHAKPPVSVLVKRGDGPVRIEVLDGSDALPRLKGFGETSTTGRGLYLVEAASAKWASEHRAPGKVVWFELDPARPRPEAAPANFDRWGEQAEDEADDEEPPPGSATGDTLTVRILALPLSVYLEAERHNDAILREFSLVAGSDPEHGVPRRLIELSRQVRGYFAPTVGGMRHQVDQAMAAGATTVDITFSVPHPAVHALIGLAELLDEADSYCRAGELLTLASSPLTKRFRDWYRAQVADQAAGRPATPWSD